MMEPMSSTAAIDRDQEVPKIHRQQFSIPQLNTSSVIIYPSRAAIVRTIKGVVLKPGRNEVVLHQLTPAADEDSIKVSGRLISSDGLSTVLLLSDMTVDLVKPPGNTTDNNTKLSSNLDHSDSDSSSESDVTISENETPTLSELNTHIRQLERQIKDRDEEIESIDKRLTYLSKWGDMLQSPAKAESDKIDRSLNMVKHYISEYEGSRKELSGRRSDCRSEVEALEKKLAKARTEATKLSDKLLRKKRKAHDKRKAAKEEERVRRLEEGKEDKVSSSQGRPEKWYRVRVWIEREEEDETTEGELEIKYIVSQTGWTPRYDIVLNSTSDDSTGNGTNKPKATLTYHAHFHNRTWETWKKAMITLSTSQTAFTGINDTIPALDPWKVGLTSYIINTYASDANAAEAVKQRSQAALYSTQEKAFNISKALREGAEEEKNATTRSAGPQRNSRRSDLRKEKKSAPNIAMRKNSSMRMASISAAPPPPPPPPGAFFSLSSAPEVESYAGGWVGGGGGSSDGDKADEEEEEDASSESDAEVDSIADTINANSMSAPKPSPPKPKFVNQGLTSSYSIPHPMTIPSASFPPPLSGSDTGSSAIRRHTILSISFEQITMSYACTPKYRAAAYLKARILNSSNTSFRKGPVGITLDGTYVGTVNFTKTIYPGSFFNLNLGVDESVSVNYAKPTVKRSVQKARGGILKQVSWSGGLQEMVAVYARSTVIRNNRLDRGPIELVVIDQVPVSEDAKLVINVLLPRGLRPPLPDDVLNRRIPEEREIVDEDDDRTVGQGSSMKAGPPVRAGTGVYTEGMKVVIEEEQSPPTNPVINTPIPAQLPRKHQSSQSAQIHIDRDDDSDVSNTGSTSTSKRRSSFFGSLKFSQSNKPESTLSPPYKPPRQPTVIMEATPYSTYSNQPPVDKKRPEEKWGSAVAVMRKNGEVEWKVKLNPGMGVRLGLDYECRVPAGEAIKGL